MLAVAIVLEGKRAGPAAKQGLLDRQRSKNRPGLKSSERAWRKSVVQCEAYSLATSPPDARSPISICATRPFDWRAAYSNLGQLAESSRAPSFAETVPAVVLIGLHAIG